MSDPEPTGTEEGADAGTPARRRRRTGASPAASPGTEPTKGAIAPSGSAPPAGTAKESAPTEEETPAPKRATLSPEVARALALRRETDRRRPRFVRQAAHRYARIGRWESWRRPRGLQSKQRRHYGYRPTVVSIGFRSPAAARGLLPNGFRPVVVRTREEIEAIDGRTQAIYIARTVGTRRRLALEEAARRLGIRVLNPIAAAEEET
ncbi:MAG: 50S ribosomal protein L32e [Thermoplasmata archaeon]